MKLGQRKKIGRGSRDPEQNQTGEGDWKDSEEGVLV